MASANQPQLGSSLRSPGRSLWICVLSANKPRLVPAVSPLGALARENRVTQGCSGKENSCSQAGIRSPLVVSLLPGSVCIGR